MLRTPKQRFLESAHSGAWGKIASGETYDEMIHAALLELQSHMPMECPAPQQACDAHQQMIGARKLADIISTLHIKDTTPQPNQPKGLNYQAGV